MGLKSVYQLLQRINCQTYNITVSSCSGAKDVSCTCGNVQLTPLPGSSCTSPSSQTNTRTCKWGYSSGTVQNAFSSDPRYNLFFLQIFALYYNLIHFHGKDTQQFSAGRNCPPSLSFS